MSLNPPILSGLSDIAGQYDALICDVWGVLHNGEHAFAPAVAALQKFRAGHGKVVLLTNAPRPPHCIVPILRELGVPDDAYDAIVSSGGTARADLERRGHIALMHIGPEKDAPVFEGLDVSLTDPERADVALCTGLFDDDTETPEDYRETLHKLLQHKVPMLCANPDLVVQRGSQLIYCAGAIAALYKKLGGEVVWYGKPHPPIYATALEAAGHPSHPLVVGDAIETDIKGANTAGLDVLFVIGGIHSRDVPVCTPEAVGVFLAAEGATARAAISALSW